MSETQVNYKNGQIDLEDLEACKFDDVAAVIVQSPNFFGIIEDVEEIVRIAHKNNALCIASVDPISLGILKSPGELGADIVVGEGQSLGNPLSFGGPYLGFFATTKAYMRKMPGRIVGETTDSCGKRGFVLTLQAREQHIRREKATSNICSNQALNALAATVYLSTLGKQGLYDVCNLCMQKSHYLFDKLIDSGKFNSVFTAPFFKEFIVYSNKSVDDLNKKLYEAKIIGGYDVGKKFSELKNTWLIAVTEKRSKKQMDDFLDRVVSI